MIDQSLDFIGKALANGQKVLIHCNKGESRSPSIALLFLAARLQALPTNTLEDAEKQFKVIYPYYNPSNGMREHIRQNWQQYCPG